MARVTGGLVGRIRETAEQRLGVSFTTAEEREDLVEAAKDGRVASREAERLAYEVLSALPWLGEQRDPPARDRMKIARQAGDIWERDPQGGAVVEMLNNFVCGRGIAKPKCHDQLVQQIVDEAWDDPDNQLALTSEEAQRAVNTDLTVQSNVFMLLFDQGDDGIVKLGVLNHDYVQDVVRDPDNRLRILYYVCREKREKWDFSQDRREVSSETQIRYYQHWRNERSDTKAPTDKLGKGRVFHLRTNRRIERAFGSPTMRRFAKWLTAFNEIGGSQVDVHKAIAALLMKRKITGGPKKVAQLAQQQLSRTDELGASTVLDPHGHPPRPGSVLNENPGVEHEPLNLSGKTAEAQQASQMARSQVSAGSGFPQHYLGDSSNATLSGATAMELPVLKLVEARQQLMEALFRWFVDRVIERAVETGRIPAELNPQEVQQAKVDRGWRWFASPEGIPRLSPTRSWRDQRGRLYIEEVHPGAESDEEMTQRDLGYELSMPNPLKRSMTDLITSLATIARTFDPNGTNMELSRALLTIALAEGLEVEDAPGVVERIFPPGYQDPIMAQQLPPPGQPPPPGQEQQQPPGQPPAPAPDSGAVGPDGQRHQAGNPYGAKQKPGYPQDVQQAADQVLEAHLAAMPPRVRAYAEEQAREAMELFDEDFGELLTQVAVASAHSNGGTPS